MLQQVISVLLTTLLFIVMINPFSFLNPTATFYNDKYHNNHGSINKSVQYFQVAGVLGDQLCVCS